MSDSLNILDENSRNLRKELPCDDETESPIKNDNEEFPTTGIRVLLVDADSNSLLLMKNLMAQYSYQVTKYENGEDAMAFLMKSKHEIDLVIWDFYMPDISGLDALNTIGKEMDLPVLIMSHDHKKETAMKSTKHGACDFLVKPVSKEVIAVLWRHVFRKRMSKYGLDKTGESDTVESDPDEYDDFGKDNLYHSNEEGSKNTSDQKGEKSSSKKPRITWTSELHQKFEVAVEKFGSLGKAVTKQILKCIQEDLNVQGLTRNNIASHLQLLRWQKYRLNSNKRARTHQETQEDFGWHNAAPDPPLAASNAVLRSSVNLHARASYLMNDQAAPRASYFVNDQAGPRASFCVKDQAAVNTPIQYSSNSYLSMNNNYFMTNFTYIGQFQQPQQQFHPSLNLPSMLTKQEPRNVSSAMENSDQLIYDSTFPFGHDECFPPAGFNNFDQFGRN